METPSLDMETTEPEQRIPSTETAQAIARIAFDAARFEASNYGVGGFKEEISYESDVNRLPPTRTTVETSDATRWLIEKQKRDAAMGRKLRRAWLGAQGLPRGRF